MDTRTILLDVGGSYIKRQSGEPLPIPSDGSRDAIAAALRASIAPGVERVGVAIPGPFDYRTGCF